MISNGKLFNIQKKWNQIEYFDEKWKDRIRQMSEYVPEGSKIIDIGCGKMWLKEFLKKDCEYIGLDYVKRGDECIVYDLNKKEFPNIKVNVSFISGCMEYVSDWKWFIDKIASSSDMIILSYCILEEFPIISDRKRLTWVNHLSNDDIINQFELQNYNLTTSTYTKTKNKIFIFKKNE
jgi:hypothetical protein